MNRTNAPAVGVKDWNRTMTNDLAQALAKRLLHGVRNSKEAQAVYREANAAGVGEAVVRKVRMGRVAA